MSVIGIKSRTATASSWDSFRDTLVKVLDIMNPKTVFEYGPGVSTEIIAAHPSVELVDSVEHDIAWHQKWAWKLSEKVNLMFQPEIELYPEQRGRVDKYDLIFVDGKDRVNCIYVSRGRLNDGGVIVLHDAERLVYQEIIATFAYKFFTDDYHTVTLTDSGTTADKLGGLYV